MEHIALTNQGATQMTRTVFLRSTPDKNGRARFYYWSLARRWLPIPAEKAAELLASGKAVRSE
jgi:hypothetical protein